MVVRTGQQGQTANEYSVRRYRPDDRDGLLELDREVWNREHSPEWFEWKYGSNPYVDHVPVFVVEHDGEIVGARPFMGFRMRAGDETVVALQPSDTMVHPDHRRKGLFTRMTERSIEFYEDREPAFFFNFPNAQSRPGYLKLGWQHVGPRATYYRVQNPGTFLESRVRDPFDRLLGRAAVPVVRGYNSIRQFFGPSGDGFTVRREHGVDATRLAELYEHDVPPQLHALRDQTFYRWRFASPTWNRITYTAGRNGAPQAAALVRRRSTDDGVTIIQVADVAPMTGDDGWAAAIAAILEMVLEDHARADIVAVSDAGIPHDLLAQFGFFSDVRFPLSTTTRSSTTVARLTPDDDDWTVNGRDLTDRDNWLFSFCERDTQ